MRPETRATRAAVLVAVAVLAGACERDAPAAPAPAPPAPLDAARLEALLGSRPRLGAPCDAAPTAVLSGRLSLHLLVAASVSQDRAEQVLRSLPGYFGARGVDLSLRGAPERVDDAPLLARGDEGQALAPLARFLARHAVPAAAAVNVVVLPRIAAPDSPAARYFSELEGLSFFPAGRAESPELYTLLELPPRFTPTVLLGADDIAHRRPGSIDLSAAHELGHVLGLAHAAGNDLMAMRPPPCVPELREDQRAALQAALGAE